MFEKHNLQTGLSISIGLPSSCLRPKWHQTSDLVPFLGSNSGKVTSLTETPLLPDLLRSCLSILLSCTCRAHVHYPQWLPWWLNLTASFIAIAIIVICQPIITHYYSLLSISSSQLLYQCALQPCLATVIYHSDYRLR